MKIIVGLGNIGAKYDGTRHNVGFMLIDWLYDSLNLTKEIKSIENGEFVRFKDSKTNEDIVLAKPYTFMNLSGDFVRILTKYFNQDIRCEDILIIHDEKDLEVGTFKYKLMGSSSSHNGIKDISNKTTCGQNFSRLRIGIANNNLKRKSLTDFVLGKFSNNDLELLLPIKKTLLESLFYFFENGIIKTMNKYNV